MHAAIFINVEIVYFKYYVLFEEFWIFQVISNIHDICRIHNNRVGIFFIFFVSSSSCICLLLSLLSSSKQLLCIPHLFGIAESVLIFMILFCTWDVW